MLYKHGKGVDGLHGWLSVHFVPDRNISTNIRRMKFRTDTDGPQTMNPSDLLSRQNFSVLCDKIPAMTN